MAKRNWIVIAYNDLVAIGEFVKNKKNISMSDSIFKKKIMVRIEY